VELKYYSGALRGDDLRWLRDNLTLDMWKAAVLRQPARLVTTHRPER